MNTSADELRIRHYQDGDDAELADLFNRVFKRYAGFVPRTAEYWRWNCKNRPDVEKKGIMVAVRGKEVVAYVVAGRSGNIWESCFDPACTNETVAIQILEKAVEYLTEVKAEYVKLNLTLDDLSTRNVCEKLGFVKIPSEKMYISVLDFQQLLQLVFFENRDELEGFGSLLISIKDAPFWVQPRVKLGETSQEATSRSKADVFVETDVATLMSLLLGTSTPLRMLLRLRLKVRPVSKTRKALRLLSRLRQEDPWFFPRSDFG